VARRLYPKQRKNAKCGSHVISIREISQPGAFNTDRPSFCRHVNVSDCRRKASLASAMSTSRGTQGDSMTSGMIYVTCVIFCALVTGCVASGRSNFEYAAPTVKVTPASEAVINEPFDAVWDRLVGRLATGFFVINNIDKASRLINVSYSGDSPGDFIDCGRSTRQFSFNGESRTYIYQVAESSSFKATSSWGPLNNLPMVGEVSRRTSVDGRINLYVAPISTTATKVSANVKYILRVSVGGVSTAYNAFGAVVNQSQITQTTEDISFSTTESTSKNWGTPPHLDLVTCQTTGKLEQSLLDKAKA
jgi:hypothetical protein